MRWSRATIAAPNRAASHEGYKDLPGSLRHAVRVLGALLRLAESLDRSRHAMIRALTVNTRADTISLELEGRGDAELEVWAAARQLAPLERALDRPVRMQTRIVDDAEPSEPSVPARRGLGKGTAPRATRR